VVGEMKNVEEEQRKCFCWGIDSKVHARYVCCIAPQLPLTV